ncbi:MAG: hypothetical protein JWN03_2248 [Nocardia sp.]|uniref:GNAT family N-acetyltransferase n=1 Tax=Nocardia sp. TaxID=1821 RepID=UPI002606187D|nr:GNAT family N-acetyltransferase [Nocardia sp.]MCU1641973.1 hypothetical protein [Nocardia sp.]
MTEVIIRKARAEDEPALADLNWGTWSPASEITPRPPRGAQFFHEASRPEDYLVAELEDRVVAYLRLVQPIPVPSAAHVRQIQGLAVDESARNNGIGRAMLTAAMAEARRQGATRLTLHVLATNDEARRLYEKSGFALEGTLHGEFFVDGRYIDDLLLARAL